MRVITCILILNTILRLGTLLATSVNVDIKLTMMKALVIASSVSGWKDSMRKSLSALLLALKINIQLAHGIKQLGNRQATIVPVTGTITLMKN